MSTTKLDRRKPMVVRGASIWPTFRQLLADVGRLIHSWWRSDQIRISMKEGQLLRLEPPCILWIQHRFAEVLSRGVGETPRGPYVCYECQTERGIAELWLSIAKVNETSEIWWIEGEVVTRIQESDVGVYTLNRKPKDLRVTSTKSGLRNNKWPKSSWP